MCSPPGLHTGMQPEEATLCRGGMYSEEAANGAADQEAPAGEDWARKWDAHYDRKKPIRL